MFNLTAKYFRILVLFPIKRYHRPSNLLRICTEHILAVSHVMCHPEAAGSAIFSVCSPFYPTMRGCETNGREKV